jgi:hypothetical protein
MKIFISWSGDVSHKVALVLRDWLPSVIQTIEPYVSSEDIDKGARWATDIAGELEKSSYGILCITANNIDAPWMNFEAGALSKAIDSSHVSPFLFRIKRSDITTGPLLQFQSTLDSKNEVFKLLQSINKQQKDAMLDEYRLQHSFDVWWPECEKRLTAIDPIVPAAHPKAKDKTIKEQEVLEEILRIVIQQNRIINSPTDLIPELYLIDVLDKYDSRRGVSIDHQAFTDLFDGVAALEKILPSMTECIEKVSLMDTMKAMSKAAEYIRSRTRLGRRRYIASPA